MQYVMTVFHLNRTLALAKGLASEEQHKYPYTDACMSGKRSEEAVRYLWQEHCYAPVAVVTVEVVGGEEAAADAMEYAFSETNHKDVAWNMNNPAHVHALHTSGNRSTSVGDIIELEGDLYRVASCGFEKLHDLK